MMPNSHFLTMKRLPMSPTGHLVTASSLALAYLHHVGLPIPAALESLCRIVTQPTDSITHDQCAALISSGVILGSRGPDRLEITHINWAASQRVSLIPHRTLTHWPPLWAFFTWLAWDGLKECNDSLPCILTLVGFGFCVGSWLYLLFDVMTPMGIPLLSPFGTRTTLNVYKTQSLGEIACIGVFVGICYIFPGPVDW